MESFYIWPESRALSLVVLVIVAMAFCYFAREPMQNVFRTLAQATAGGFHLLSEWCREIADHLKEHIRQAALESGLTAQERKIEQEFRRLETAYAKGLNEYPKLHLKLDGNITRIDGDYEESSEVPPEVPGWTEVVEAVANVKGVEDRTVRKMLDEIHKSAVEGEKRALQEYRTSISKRHKILATMAPYWKEAKGTLDRIGKSIEGLIETTRRIDSYMERYEKLRDGESRALRALESSAIQLFVISSLVITIAAAAAFINFQLIALPMSELVPGGARLMGMPVATVAALVIVLMEVAAGVFLLDALGITNLFPQLGSLSLSRRRIIFFVSLGGIFLLAAIECSLAVLREQLVEAEIGLMATLAGSSDAAVADATASVIPVVGQAVLGFTLPWILAMIAIPLEMWIESARHIVGRLLIGLLVLTGLLSRFLSYASQYLILIVAHLYDAFIMIPVQIEAWVRGEKAAKRKSLTVEELSRGAALAAMQGVTQGKTK